MCAKCNICEVRPARSNGLCGQCNSKLEAQKRASSTPEPTKFFQYRGIVVGLYPDGQGNLVPKLLKRNPETLPKSKVLNLDGWLDGYTREQVKSFKRACLVLAS